MYLVLLQAFVDVDNIDPYKNMAMPIPSIGKEKKVFTLKEARMLIPNIKNITSNTIKTIEGYATKLDLLADDDPEFTKLGLKLDRSVQAWVTKVKEMGAEVKGLWLVDFDNGHGYYSWSYPEEELDYFHEYDADYSDRMPIC